MEPVADNLETRYTIRKKNSLFKLQRLATRKGISESVSLFALPQTRRLAK